MAVNDKQKRYLKGLAHPLKPVVMIGNKGLTDNVLAEIDKALEQHELIKVRVSGLEKADRTAMVEEITLKSSANLIVIIGHIAVLYRPAKEPTIQLPKK
jgi:RNA-binding protein